MYLSYRFFILALLSQAEDMIHTNVQCSCTHDYLKDLLLIRLEFVCSPTIWVPGCRVNDLSEGLSLLARVLPSPCCLDSVMCNATMKGFVGELCVRTGRVHYSLELLWDTHLYNVLGPPPMLMSFFVRIKLLLIHVVVVIIKVQINRLALFYSIWLLKVAVAEKPAYPLYSWVKWQQLG